MLIAVFGIDNDGLNLVVNLLILFLVVVWFALVYWTYTDARRRIEDPVLIASAAAASLFPYIGTVVYTIVRPPEYLDDVRERELEIRAAEVRLQQLQEHLCPYCDFEVERSFLRCPSCLRRLKEPCVSCGKPLDPRWKLCPYCEAEIVQAPPPRSTRRSAERERERDRSERERSERYDRAERQSSTPPPRREGSSRRRASLG